MEKIFENFDEFGPKKIIAVSDYKTGMKGVLVIHNTALGMGKGGTRMSPDLTVPEVYNLAKNMTWKWALADIPLGGAKAGIKADPNAENKEEILRSFARALKKHVPDEYIFGLDMGLDESDAAIIVDELDNKSASLGKPAALGGIPYDEWGSTGYGVAKTIEVMAKRKNLTPSNTSVSIQGFGAVGKAAAKFLDEMNFNIVAVSNVEGVLYNQNGLEIEKLLDLHSEYGDAVIREYKDGETKKLGEELTLDNIDILIPAAIQDVIDENNAKNIDADIIVEGANMPTTSKGEEILKKNNKIVVPDFLANAGGIITAAIAMDHINSFTKVGPEIVYETIEEKMKANVNMVVDEAESNNETLREAAMKIAKNRVVEAMELRSGRKISL